MQLAYEVALGEPLEYFKPCLGQAVRPWMLNWVKIGSYTHKYWIWADYFSLAQGWGFLANFSDCKRGADMLPAMSDCLDTMDTNLVKPTTG